MSESSNMYKHVVLFKFFDKTSPETMRAIETAFHDLCARLPFVTGFEWGPQFQPGKSE